MTKTKPASCREEFEIAIDNCSFYRSQSGRADINCDDLFNWVEQERIKAQVEVLEGLLEPFIEKEVKNREGHEQDCCKLANQVMAKSYELQRSQN